MAIDLTTTMRKALVLLRNECDFEESRLSVSGCFIARDKLSPGIGEKTLSDLTALGLIESCYDKGRASKSYRITPLGREALKDEPKEPARKPRRMLKALQPRLFEKKR